MSLMRSAGAAAANAVNATVATQFLNNVFMCPARRQNGDKTELKNRVSQPMRLALAITPLPE
jgi:hypothetical protein